MVGYLNTSAVQIRTFAYVRIWTPSKKKPRLLKRQSQTCVWPGFLLWSGREDSNLRPHPPQRCALPLRHVPVKPSFYYSAPAGGARRYKTVIPTASSVRRDDRRALGVEPRPCRLCRLAQDAGFRPTACGFWLDRLPRPRRDPTAEITSELVNSRRAGIAFPLNLSLIDVLEARLSRH